MKIFGYEFIVRKAQKPLSPLEALKASVDEINRCWETIEGKGNTIRPWIIWDEKRVVLTKREGAIQVIHGGDKRCIKL